MNSPVIDKDVDELRVQYSFEPVCRYEVMVFLTFQRRWDSDGYFLTRSDADEHMQELRASNLRARVVKCESNARCIEVEEG
jgi:hypothetical protein